MSFFEQCGDPTGLTARSNDFGVDGFVMHLNGIIVVQCKRYAINNPVGRPAVQQFKGVIGEQQAYRGHFVTTSRFTDEAREIADKSSRAVTNLRCILDQRSFPVRLRWVSYIRRSVCVDC